MSSVLLPLWREEGGGLERGVGEGEGWRVGGSWRDTVGGDGGEVYLF